MLLHRLHFFFGGGGVLNLGPVVVPQEQGSEFGVQGLRIHWPKSYRVEIGLGLMVRDLWGHRR